MQNADNQRNIIQSGGFVFKWKLSPAIFTSGKMRYFASIAVWIKRKTAGNDLLSAVFIIWLLFGDPLGARTQDPNIKSVVLYLLS